MNNSQLDVDYKTFVISLIPKKKQMRRAMMMEYAKELVTYHTYSSTKIFITMQTSKYFEERYFRI